MNTNLEEIPTDGDLIIVMLNWISVNSSRLINHLGVMRAIVNSMEVKTVQANQRRLTRVIII